MAAVLAVILLLSPALLPAIGGSSLSSRALTMEDGLCHNTVYSVIQDSTGFTAAGRSRATEPQRITRVVPTPRSTKERPPTLSVRGRW